MRLSNSSYICGDTCKFQVYWLCIYFLFHCLQSEFDDINPVHLKFWIPSREIWTSSRSGTLEKVSGSTRPSARSCPWAEATLRINIVGGMRELRVLLRRRTCVYWQMKGWACPSTCLRLHQEHCGQQVTGDDSASALLWWNPSWRASLSSGAPSARRIWTNLSRCKGIHKGWNTSPMKTGWKNWDLFNLDKRRL